MGVFAAAKGSCVIPPETYTACGHPFAHLETGSEPKGWKACLIKQPAVPPQGTEAMPKSTDIPACPEVPNVRSLGGETREYQIRLITPLFGGGVAAGETDSTLPIRGTSIRGQLRHWWRLTGGHALGERMWQREEEIFGSTEFPSPLTVRVLNWSKNEQFDPSDRNIVPQFSSVAYALFPAI